MAKKKVWVVGHKHPDTDSICAAISYANLKNEIEKKNPKTATGMTYIAKRAGSVNAETAYVLERFHAEAPAMISDVGTQIKDIKAVFAKEQFAGEGVVIKRGKKNFKKVILK